MRKYKCLDNPVFSEGEFSIVPIREEDKLLIMKWRNEQIYHLRQAKLLTEADQTAYFQNIVAKLFESDKPNQILFSYLQNDICIGYGGLVHINWIDKNAEISFIINTELEKDFFEFHWLTYLKLIEKVAFDALYFHKLFTYAFDLRPNLYIILEKFNFVKEAILKEHCLFDGKFIDVIIHSKINSILRFRKTNKDDIDLYFEWANDETTRQNSFNSEKISFELHCKWFLNKIEDKNTLMLIFENEINQAIGQVRIEQKADENVIGISIDKSFRGKGFASKIIEIASDEFFKKYNLKSIIAYIKKENQGSLKGFQKANFKIIREEIINNSISFVLEKNKN